MSVVISRSRCPLTRCTSNPAYTFSAPASRQPGWTRSTSSVAHTGRAPLAMTPTGTYAFTLRDRDEITQVSFGNVCTVANTGGAVVAHWSGDAGRTVLSGNDQQPAEPGPRAAVGVAAERARRTGSRLAHAAQQLALPGQRRWLAAPRDGRPFDQAYDQFRGWLTAPPAATRPARCRAVWPRPPQHGVRQSERQHHDQRPGARDWPIVRHAAGSRQLVHHGAPGRPRCGRSPTAERYRAAAGYIEQAIRRGSHRPHRTDARRRPSEHLMRYVSDSAARWLCWPVLCNRGTQVQALAGRWCAPW